MGSSQNLSTGRESEMKDIPPGTMPQIYCGTFRKDPPFTAAESTGTLAHYSHNTWFRAAVQSFARADRTSRIFHCHPHCHYFTPHCPLGVTALQVSIYRITYLSKVTQPDLCLPHLSLRPVFTTAPHCLPKEKKSLRDALPATKVCICLNSYLRDGIIGYK